MNAGIDTNYSISCCVEPSYPYEDTEEHFVDAKLDALAYNSSSADEYGPDFETVAATVQALTGKRPERRLLRFKVTGPKTRKQISEKTDFGEESMTPDYNGPCGLCPFPGPHSHSFVYPPDPTPTEKYQ